jgi:ribose-phosphate pyrophosphokinase
MRRLVICAPARSRPLGQRMAEQLGQALAPLEEREFEDGEHKLRPLASVRGSDVFVVQALHGEAGATGDQKLVRLLFACAALRDAGADRITAVVPYLCYARKDRRTKPRDPVSTRTVARLIEAVDVDRVAVLDVHNLQAYENAFRVPAEHLEAWPALVGVVAERLAGRPAAVVSPDLGGIARADRLARGLGARLGGPMAVGFLEKRRSEGVVTGQAFVGDVAGRVAVVVDDLVTTGGTMVRAGEACLANGASAVIAVATHGVFARGAEEALGGEVLERMIVTDSVDPARPGAPAIPRLEVVGIAPLLAEAVARMHGGGSLVAMFEP